MDPRLVVGLREARHRVVADHGRQLRPAAGLEPGRRAVTVAERGRGSGSGQLVDVVQQRRRLHQPAVHGATVRRRPQRQPRGDVRHGARVAQEPLGRFQGAQQAGGLGPRGDRHRKDRSRWGRRGRPVPTRPRSASPRPSHADAVGAELHLDRAVQVGPVDPGAGVPEAPERGGRRVAVVVAGPDRDQRHGRPSGRQQRGGRRGRAAVVGDLEHVEARQPSGDQRRVHVLLGITGEQEPPAARLAQQDDRGVVDPTTRVRRVRRARCRGRATGPSAGSRRAGSGRPLRGFRAVGRASRPRPMPPSRVPGRACRARTPGPRGTARAARTSPATWSSWGWVRTSTSIRRSHGGMRASSCSRSRSGSGPPSTSIRAPPALSTRMASPWPTSSITRRVVRVAASPRASVATPMTSAAATAMPRWAAVGPGRDRDPAVEAWPGRRGRSRRPGP